MDENAFHESALATTLLRTAISASLQSSKMVPGWETIGGWRRTPTAEALTTIGEAVPTKDPWGLPSAASGASFVGSAGCDEGALGVDMTCCITCASSWAIRRRPASLPGEWAPAANTMCGPAA